MRSLPLLAVILSCGLVCSGLVGCGAPGVAGSEVNEAYRAELQSVQSEYRLRAGDNISISFINAENYSQQELVIREDGGVSTNLGEVHIAGMTIKEAEGHVGKSQTVVVNPVVVIRVNITAPSFVWVTGEVEGPGSVVYRPGMTALEAVSQQGGNLPTGKMRSVLLIRYLTPETRAVHRVDLKELTTPLLLLPRDIVYVPRTNIANVNEFVAQYIRGVLPVNPTVGPV